MSFTSDKNRAFVSLCNHVRVEVQSLKNICGSISESGVQQCHHPMLQTMCAFLHAMVSGLFILLRDLYVPISNERQCGLVV